jgi:hypothetical protein
MKNFKKVEISRHLSAVRDYLAPRFTLVVLCFIGLQGCFLKRNVPVVAQTRSASCVLQGRVNFDTTNIFVVNRGWRLSLVLPSEEVVEELGWVFDEVHNHPWIEFSWGELEEVVSAEYLATINLGELGSAEKFALVKGATQEPKHSVENAEVIRVTVERGSLQKLTQGVKRGVFQTETGASSIAYSGPQNIGTLYRGAPDQWSGGNAVRWMAHRLSEGGCQVDISTTRVSTVLSALK